MQDISLLSTKILECQLSEDSTEVAVTIAGYVAKKLKKDLDVKLVIKKWFLQTKMFLMNTLKYYPEYLKILCPSQPLSDFICHLFSILDIISPIIIKHCSYSFSIKSFAEVFKIYCNSVNFICDNHQEWGIKYGSRIVINIFITICKKKLQIQ